MHRLLLGLSLLLSLLALPATGQTVTDGDTIRFDGKAVRLWGIDAAELHQRCADGWPAGELASQHLADLMRDRAITCEPRTIDRYGRVVALCRADGEDLGAAMVSAGMAWAFIRYSREYVRPGRSRGVTRAWRARSRLREAVGPSHAAKKRTTSPRPAVSARRQTNRSLSAVASLSSSGR